VPGPVILQFAIEGLSIHWHPNARYEDIRESAGSHQYQLSPPLRYDTNIVALYPRYYSSYNKNAPNDSHHEVFIVTLISSHDGRKPLFWFGKKYQHVVKKDRSSDEERESVYNETIRNSINRFTLSSKSDSVTLLELNRRIDDYQYFQSAVDRIPNNRNAALPILTEIHERKSVSYTLRAALIAFGVGQLIWAVICMFIRVNPITLANQEKLSPEGKFKMRRAELKESLSWFLPRKGYIATPIILDINIIIYLLLGFLGVSLMSPSGDELIPYGSSYSPLVMEGQIWRLFTCGFLHFGFIHLFMNMIALGCSGFMLEQVLGTRRFTILYLVSLIGCSLTSLYCNYPGNSAGASGAIFGIMGAMLFYALFNIGDSENRTFFLVIFMIFGLFTLITDMIAWSHSDMAGHLGGMITGMLVAIFFIPAARKAEEITM
jgi:membrane associated rhomboid family serine protease